MLVAAGYRLHRVAPPDGKRPLCCGRTYLSAGLVDEARREARRTLDALSPFVAKGARVVGLEPSCLLTFRDEFAVLLPKAEARRSPSAAFLFEELLAADLEAGSISLPLQPTRAGGSRICTAIATRRPSARWARWRRTLRAVPGPRRAADRIELLRHGRRLRL